LVDLSPIIFNRYKSIILYYQRKKVKLQTTIEQLIQWSSPLQDVMNQVNLEEILDFDLNIFGWIE
jgi:hypothetical protein